MLARGGTRTYSCVIRDDVAAAPATDEGFGGQVFGVEARYVEGLALEHELRRISKSGHCVISSLGH